MVRKKKCTIAPVRFLWKYVSRRNAQLIMKRALYKGPQGYNNHTVEELEEDADCIWSVRKYVFVTFSALSKLNVSVTVCWVSYI